MTEKQFVKIADSDMSQPENDAWSEPESESQKNKTDCKDSPAVCPPEIAVAPPEIAAATSRTEKSKKLIKRQPKRKADPANAPIYPTKPKRAPKKRQKAKEQIASNVAKKSTKPAKQVKPTIKKPEQAIKRVALSDRTNKRPIKKPKRFETSDEEDI